MKQEYIESLKKMVRREAAEMHTAVPGTIISFDPVKCQAVVQPVMKFEKPDGTKMDYPQISGVPVAFPQAASMTAVIAYPVKPGDSCLLIFMEQALDYWMYGQETQTNLRFDLTNCVCIPGLFNTGNAYVQQAQKQDAIVIARGGVNIAVSPNCVDITGDVNINGALTVDGILMNRHTHQGVHGGTSGPR